MESKLRLLVLLIIIIVALYFAASSYRSAGGTIGLSDKIVIDAEWSNAARVKHPSIPSQEKMGVALDLSFVETQQVSSINPVRIKMNRSEATHSNFGSDNVANSVTTTRTDVTDEIQLVRKASSVAASAAMCDRWNCTCQGFSNKYGTFHGYWGAARNLNDVSRNWWREHDCHTRPTGTGDMSTTVSVPNHSGCEVWNCSCQGFSNLYGTSHGSWSMAKDPISQAWWIVNKCRTTPEASGSKIQLEDDRGIIVTNRIVRQGWDDTRPRPNSLSPATNSGNARQNAPLKSEANTGPIDNMDIKSGRIARQSWSI